MVSGKEDEVWRPIPDGEEMDDITAGLMSSVGKPNGASLFFQTQWFPENINKEDDFVEIVNTVTKHWAV